MQDGRREGGDMSRLNEKGDGAYQRAWGRPRTGLSDSSRFRSETTARIVATVKVWRRGALKLTNASGPGGYIILCVCIFPAHVLPRPRGRASEPERRTRPETVATESQLKCIGIEVYRETQWETVTFKRLRECAYTLLVPVA